MTQPLKGKTCLITGITQGIGRAAALEIAKTGINLVLVARDAARGQEVVDEIKTQTGNHNVELLLGDLSKTADVRRIADEFKAKHPQLHLLVNNAGAVFTSRQTTADGFEMTFGLNHLSYFLLTHLLLDTLKKSAPARIVNVASDAHKGMKLNFDDLQSERGYSAFRVYGQSKLANILFTNELARRLQGTGVTVNALHPGVVATGFGKNNGAFLRFLVKLAGPLLRTPEQGARTTVYLATSPEVEGVTGKYFANSKEARSTQESLDPQNAKRLWEVSEKLLKI